MNDTFLSDSRAFRVTEETLPLIAQVADQMPGGFLLYRAGGTMDLLHVSHRTLEIFGCGTLEEFKDLTGFTFPGLIHPEDAEEVLRSIDEQISDASNNDLDYVEYRIRRRDGTIRWVDDYGHLVRSREHGDLYYVFLNDITDKKAAEAAARALEQERHLNEIRSTFLFNLSHDLRTPMNAVIGFADLARRHMDERDWLEEYLGMVEEAGHHMLDLIDDLLEINRLDSGAIRLDFQPWDLAEQVEKALDLVRAQAEEKGLTLEEHLDLAGDRVVIDAPRLRRILGNLLDNAVKFTPAGGKVTLSARRTQTSESGFSRYTFTVADTGVGMTEEFMERMFDAFEREQTSTQTGAAGTGLGLTITKNLLDMLGGTISVESAKGEGSVFTVDLAMKQAGDTTQEPETAPAPDPRAEGDHRVLVAEDIEINRMLAETILEEAGFLVESVSDGCDAVEAVKTHPAGYYDLILMDIQMPVMNGYEATRAIRALDREDAKALPILALSANAREEDRRESLASGMNSHLSKPFDVTQLIGTVNDYIAGREK